MRCIIGRPTSGISPIRVRVSGVMRPDPVTASIITVRTAPQITMVKLGSMVRHVVCEVADDTTHGADSQR
jgi:hypothetical protein